MDTQISSDETLLPVNVLWIGGKLGPVEQLSILSFIRAGHRVRLHAYEDIGNVPPAVELVDAELTVPRRKMEELRYFRTGSYALAADFFRYVLQARGEGFWADLDMICLRPIKRDQVVFGCEAEDRLNVALLYLDAHLPIVNELIDLFRNHYIPPWVDEKIARKRRLKRWLPGRRIRPAIMPWGTYGPHALTVLAKQHNLFQHAQPVPVYYPLPFQEAHQAFNPAFSFESIIQEDTCTIHLWNEGLARLGLRGAQPPKGSPLDRLFKEYGL